jgi:hypothetical protein
MRIVKMVFGVLCLGIGVAFIMVAVKALVYPRNMDDAKDVWIPAMFGAIFCLGSYLLFPSQ